MPQRIWAVYKDIWPDDGLVGLFSSEEKAHAACGDIWWRDIEVWDLDGDIIDTYYRSPTGQRTTERPR